MNRGKLIILSSPSGGGKTTVYKRLLRDLPDLRYSVSYTTRQPRPGEVHGRDYFFVTPPEFRRMIRRREFLEWQKVFGRYYGTSRAFVEQYTDKGNHVIMDLDVKGGRFLKRRLRDRAVAIFLMPPSTEELEKRLRGRATDSPGEIKRRLAEVRKELKYRRFYDYIIINDDLDRVVGEVRSIIKERQEPC
jgi:guanylate kinase